MWESIISLHKLEKRVKIEVKIKFRMFFDYVGTTPNSVIGRLHANHAIFACHRLYAWIQGAVNHLDVCQKLSELGILRVDLDQNESFWMIDC